MGEVGGADTLFWAWFIFGIVLMISEFVVPGLVVIFLGAGAMLVSGGAYLGWITGVIDSFTYWFVLSLVLILSLRWVVQRFIPGEVHFLPADEDADAFGSVVDVIEEITSENTNGRIQFRGTTWQASSDSDSIASGKKVRIISRENTVWIVEPMEGN